MKRDVRLHGLSSEHHQALVLARALERQAARAWSKSDGNELGARFTRELEPHFQIEEDVLLPALRTAGRTDLAERLENDHVHIRKLVHAAAAGDAEAAGAVGAALAQHVRFEERELFPACEGLGDDILDEVARRTPKRR